MTLVDPQALASTLLATERDIDQMGWNQPDLLFAVHGPPWCPQLEYLLQLPGRANELLQDLYELGLRAHDDIIGLVLIAGAGHELDVDEFLALPVRVKHFAGDAAVMVERLAAAWRDSRGAQLTKALVRHGRAVVAVLRDGCVAVVVHEEGERVQMTQRLPAAVGDHDEMTERIMQLLVGEPMPFPRTSGWDEAGASW